MKFNTLFIILFIALVSTCTGNPSNAETEEPTPTAEVKQTETTFLREPIDIVASTGEDYPKSLIDLDFPILPKAEVTSVGNTEIENGTVVMQMETTATVEQIQTYYQREMGKKGWEEKKMKVFQGADAAYSYRTDEHSARIMVINDRVQDFRKVAVTLNKRVNPDKLGKQ